MPRRPAKRAKVAAKSEESKTQEESQNGSTTRMAFRYAELWDRYETRYSPSVSPAYFACWIFTALGTNIATKRCFQVQNIDQVLKLKRDDLYVV